MNCGNFMTIDKQLQYSTYKLCYTRFIKIKGGILWGFLQKIKKI